MTDLPSISVVTPAHNAADTLAHCITSVASQTYPAEHLIIDGASSDGTSELVNRLLPESGTFVSEPDQGIYDAMNKGISRARGEIIGILNADDFYANRHVLQTVAALFRDETVASCYGDLNYVSAEDSNLVLRYWKAGDYTRKSFYWGWMPPHPTFFVRRSIYEQFGTFNLGLGSSADYELLLRFLLRHNIPSVYIPELLVTMRSGGTSNRTLLNRLSAHFMDYKAWKVIGLTPYPWTILCKPLRKIPQFIFRVPYLHGDHVL